MEQIQCQVSTEAKEVLLSWQKRQGFRRQDSALENLLLEFAKRDADEEYES